MLFPTRVALGMSILTNSRPAAENGSRTTLVSFKYLFKAPLTKSLEKPAIQGAQRWIGKVLLPAKVGSLKLGDSNEDGNNYFLVK